MICHVVAKLGRYQWYCLPASFHPFLSFPTTISLVLGRFILSSYYSCQPQPTIVKPMTLVRVVQSLNRPERRKNSHLPNHLKTRKVHGPMKSCVPTVLHGFVFILSHTRMTGASHLRPRLPRPILWSARRLPLYLARHSIRMTMSILVRLTGTIIAGRRCRGTA